MANYYSYNTNQVQADINMDNAIKDIQNQLLNIPTDSQLGLKANQTDLDTTNANVAANATQLADIVHLSSYQKQGTETDDTARIQRALNTLSSKSILILEPDKTYTISSLVSLSNVNKITIMGNGAKISCSSEFGDAVKFTSCTNIVVKSLEIAGGESGPGSHAFTVTSLLSFVSCTNVLVEKCNFHNGNGIGLSATDSFNVTFRDNDVSQVNLHMMWTLRCDTVFVEDNRLTGLGNISGTLTITDSAHATQGGIGYLGTQGNNIFIRNNTIKNTTDTGTKTEGATNVIYDGNYVQDSGKDGIKIMDYPAVPSALPYNGKIINNTVVNIHNWRTDGSALIIMYNSKAGVISNNILRGGVKESGTENAVRVQYSNDVIVSENVEETAVINESLYVTYGIGLTVSDNKFQNDSNISNADGETNIHDNVFGLRSGTSALWINLTHARLHHNKFLGVVQIQPGSATKSIKFNDNTILNTTGANETLNITNFTGNIASVENVEVIDNTFKVSGTVSTGRVIRLGCDKTPYTFVKVAGNIFSLYGQNLTPLTINPDSSGNSYKITNLLKGQNYPVISYAGTDATNIVTL